MCRFYMFNTTLNFCFVYVGYWFGIRCGGEGFRGMFVMTQTTRIFTVTQHVSAICVALVFQSPLPAIVICVATLVFLTFIYFVRLICSWGESLFPCNIHPAHRMSFCSVFCPVVGSGSGLAEGALGFTEGSLSTRSPGYCAGVRSETV